MAGFLSWGVSNHRKARFSFSVKPSCNQELRRPEAPRATSRLLTDHAEKLLMITQKTVIESNINQQTSPNKLETIQSLRGIACILVALYHLTGLTEKYLGSPFLFGSFYFGWAGVELFFVLSGFIMFKIHSIHIKSYEKWLNFIKKRVIRIYPIYLTLTILVLPIYLISNFGENTKRSIPVIIKSLLLIPQEIGVFPIITVGWSLSHEIFFYLIFSLSFLLPRNAFRTTFITWCIATIIYNIAFKRFLIFSELNFIFSPYNLEFALGGFASAAAAKYHNKGSKFLVFGGIIFIIIGILHNIDWIKTPITVTSLMFATASMLIIFGAASLDLSRQPQLPRPLIYLGDASYSIYLTHGIIMNIALVITHKLISVEGIFLNFISFIILILTLLGGCAVYQWVESPLLNTMRRRLRTLEK
ncbi:O-acetyltransferase OatA [compost metagenome]